MIRRHLALPRIWLLTDERQDDRLWRVLDRLPPDVGVVVRHYSLPMHSRQALAARIASSGRFVAFSGSEAQARRARARAVYGTGSKRCRLPRVQPVHDAREIICAERAGAAMLMLSPVFPTRSHPGTRVLGPLRFALLARKTTLPVVALGGMTSLRFKRMRAAGAVGWAAIDGWIRT